MNCEGDQSIRMQVLSEIETVHSPNEQDATRKQIRGSSLFLAGRFLSMGINFSAHVLMVRYLATAEYGALAYALAAVAFFDEFVCRSALGCLYVVPGIFCGQEETWNCRNVPGTI